MGRPFKKRRFVRYVVSGLTLVCFYAALLVSPAAAEPRIMVLMEEHIMGVFGSIDVEPGLSQAGNTMMEVLKDHGYNVINPQTVKSNVQEYEEPGDIEGDENAAAAIGLQYDADFVIQGKAVSTNTGWAAEGTSFQSMHAMVTARLIRSDDGIVLAAESAEATQAHIDEVKGGTMAIKAASTEVSEKLVQALNAALLTSGSSDVHQITLRITGIASYQQLAFLRQYLQSEIEGMEEVHQRSYTSGEAELSLSYRGTATQMADILAFTDFKGFRLEPTSLTPNRLDLEVLLPPQEEQ